MVSSASIRIVVHRASLVAQMVNKSPAMQETQVPSLDQEDQLENRMTTQSLILSGESHGQRSLATVCGFTKNQI